MAHREGIRDYLKYVQVFGIVHDWGCGTKPIKYYLKENNATFIGIDKLDHVGADLVYDIEEPLELSEQADFAFCLEVIEHCWDTKQVIENIYNNLKPGGLLYFSQPYMYETHKEDDRIRFTHFGLLKLLGDVGFKDVVVTPTVGDLEHAEGFVGSARR